MALAILDTAIQHTDLMALAILDMETNSR
jgi:hypothetical protein